eukprot:GFUD01138341.1.p1 GENE.GFUD01138341.1~~GFUD01138341.1.p1  ORF type:complete len:321 (+),score=73.72 GFUD01138341.1:45-1007(+)
MAASQGKVRIRSVSPSTSGQEPDVEFRVFKDVGSYTSVLAHKSFLTSSSSVFRTQCTSSKTGCLIILQITDFPPEVLIAYLNFIYGEKTQLLGNLDIRTLFFLSNFAEKYKIKDLQEEILLVLKEYKVWQGNFLDLIKLLEENKFHIDACKALKQSLNHFITVSLKSPEDISKLFLDHLDSNGTINVSLPIWELFKDKVGTKKTVRFSDFVQEQTYVVNSVILANSAKNKKKAEKKRKSREKRSSESDWSIVNEVPEITLDEFPEGSFDDSSYDSGMASSLEESVNLDFDAVNFSDMLMDDVEGTNPFKNCDENIFNMDF